MTHMERKIQGGEWPHIYVFSQIYEQSSKHIKNREKCTKRNESWVLRIKWRKNEIYTHISQSIKRSGFFVHNNSQNNSDRWRVAKTHFISSTFLYSNRIVDIFSFPFWLFINLQNVCALICQQMYHRIFEKAIHTRNVRSGPQFRIAK